MLRFAQDDTQGQYIAPDLSLLLRSAQDDRVALSMIRKRNTIVMLSVAKHLKPNAPDPSLRSG